MSQSPSFWAATRGGPGQRGRQTVTAPGNATARPPRPSYHRSSPGQPLLGLAPRRKSWRGRLRCANSVAVDTLPGGTSMFARRRGSHRPLLPLAAAVGACIAGSAAARRPPCSAAVRPIPGSMTARRSRSWRASSGASTPPARSSHRPPSPATSSMSAAPTGGSMRSIGRPARRAGSSPPRAASSRRRRWWADRSISPATTARSTRSTRPAGGCNGASPPAASGASRPSTSTASSRPRTRCLTSSTSSSPRRRWRTAWSTSAAATTTSMRSTPPRDG